MDCAYLTDKAFSNWLSVFCGLENTVTTLYIMEIENFLYVYLFCKYMESPIGIIFGSGLVPSSLVQDRLGHVEILANREIQYKQQASTQITCGNLVVNIAVF